MARSLKGQVVPGIKGRFCTDSRLTDGVTKGIGKGVQRPPTRTVTGDDVFDSKWPQSIHRVRNDPLHDAAQM